MLNVIKEYLVSLGFKVDTQSYGAMQNAMGNADKTVSGFANNTIKNFSTAGIAVTSFVATATAGIAKFVTDLAKTDLQQEKFARQMWVSKDYATAYNNSLKAMGASLEDLYFSPELMNQFKELRNLSFQMVPPAEYQDQMKYIRSIVFEFTKMKLELTYAAQWIGYYLVKYLEGPLGDLKSFMEDLNKKIQINMPVWTKYVAQFLSWFVRLADAGLHAASALKEVFDAIPSGTKLAGGAMLGFFTLLKAGPIGWIIAGLTALLLILDDYYTYKKGGKSALESLWKENKLDSVKDTLGKIVDDLGLVKLPEVFMSDLEQVGKSLWSILNTLQELGAFKLIGSALVGSLELVEGIVVTIDTALKSIRDILKFDFSGLGKDIKEHFQKSEESTKETFPDAYKWLMDKYKSFEDWSKPFMDKLENPFGIINNSYEKAPAYTLPAQQTTYNNQQSAFNPTINVYGSGDSYATATAVHRNMTDMYIRNFAGV